MIVKQVVRRRSTINFQPILIKLLLLCYIFYSQTSQIVSELIKKGPDLTGCDQMVISNPDAPKNGTFTSPIIENSQNHTRSCTYTFIASENERIHIKFNHFDLRGSPPDCNHEYLDIYTESEDPNQDLIVTPFSGRYCGRSIPRDRVSLFQTLVLSFHTDKPLLNENIFNGTYEFIDATPFIAGTPTPREICSFTIFSDKKRDGQFLSPTYPGVYPKNLQCQYQFFGGKGQRVRVEFMDFDLLYGGAHCPFDQIRVYDGSTKEDPLIGTYCGQKRNLVLYSSGEKMLVTLTTLPRSASHENRGFIGWFEFSERFVNLGFIGKNDGEHIRGTECDQKILSRKENNGTIYSPNYPFLYHSNIICKYYIYGIQDEQHLEKIQLEFEKFEIPIKDKLKVNGIVPISNSNPNIDSTNRDDSEVSYECGDASVRVYTSSESMEDPDYVFCGTEKLPPPVVSDGPTLIVVFSSGLTQGQGFKGRYTFLPDYRIPGTPEPPRCKFKYLSESAKKGVFNSPRHPNSYPPITHCEYWFIGLPGEQIEITFVEFNLKKDSELVLGYDEFCQEDWIEMYEIHPSGREQKIGRYCVYSAPGPYVTPIGINQLKIVMKTDGADTSSGFLANYHFISRTSIQSDCGGNVTGLLYGYLRSPGYPEKYRPQKLTCNWYINVKPHHRILLTFLSFIIEGSMRERGCPTAVLRVWSDLSKPPIELCGVGLENDTQEMLSTTNMLKISFMITDTAVGARGFEALWSEVKEDGANCDALQCPKSGYCISNEMKCNGAPNCGFYDHIDEANCIKVTEVNKLMMVAMIVVGTILFMIILCSLCHRKHRRRQSADTISAQFDAPRPKQQHDLQPASIPPYLHVDSV
ncbi:cubilin isoform X2 [Tetranychus urticae]|uniref:cubilin isoform X2 n=1 Tax=Tetranychus urticae TaxID=32264 RepID=UPI00077BCB37|nr:cubilin isoform X2 [Tetranychus urticae]